jgi:hypothetical protein
LLENLDESPRQPASFVPVACIESWLPTTSLALIEFDFASRTTENFDSARAYCRPQLINQAGDEE